MAQKIMDNETYLRQKISSTTMVNPNNLKREKKKGGVIPAKRKLVKRIIFDQLFALILSSLLQRQFRDDQLQPPPI
ncbi:hypothetical protein BVRB_1g010410 [Beta vulgaris subsp. vulgaris]|nr:hypothetical protein BVRB_1g010410 [Beta vulgaris subsp. vulgaris]